MIKKIVLLSLIMLSFSCKKENEGYKIEATIDASLNDKKAELYRFENKNKRVIDSATVVEGKLLFEGHTNSPDTYFISIDGVKGFLPFILENVDIDIAIYKDSLAKSVISGSKENDLTKTYQKNFLPITEFNTELRTRYQVAQSQNDTKEMEAVKVSFDSLIKAVNTFDMDFIKDNGNYAFAAISLERLTKGQKITKEQSKTLYNLLSESTKQTRAAKETLSLIDQAPVVTKNKASVKIGDIAPNFSGLTPDEKAFSLNDNKAKLTILDFWASWCGPCRRENPNVVKLYNKYHSKGLEIIGISLDKKGQKDRWLKAIEKDQLTWKHVSNLQGWKEPIAQQYGVRSIPATFILDESGKIIAKNLRGKALEDKVAELLN